MRIARAFAGKIAAVTLALCAFAIGGCTTHIVRPAAQFGAGPPTVLYLRGEQSIATFHFPRGSYFLQSADDTGLYYRSGAGVFQHSFAGPRRADGGLFVERKNPTRMRGYIRWGGGITKIGSVRADRVDFR